MYCQICGTEEDLCEPQRFWCPDDGWRWGRLCRGCKEEFGNVKPKPTDYAFDKSGETAERVEALVGVLGDDEDAIASYMDE